LVTYYFINLNILWIFSALLNPPQKEELERRMTSAGKALKIYLILLKNFMRFWGFPEVSMFYLFWLFCSRIHESTNFVSGHNLKSSQTWDFLYQREGGMIFYQGFLLRGMDRIEGKRSLTDG
jgi:hypothetical protein